MLVGRVRSLRDQALPTLAARVSEVPFPALVPMLGEPQRIAEREQAPQDLLPVPLRHGGGVVPVRVEDVEEVEGDGHPGATSPLRIRDLHPPLQPGEARPVPLERHDLAVDHEVLGLLRGEGLDELGVVGVHLLAVAGQQPDRAPTPERQAPLPVELALEDPVGIGEGPGGEGGEHRLRPLGLLRTPEGLPSLRRERVPNDAHPVSARSRIRLPDTTDSGCVFTGLRRASAPSSFIFTRSHRSRFPLPVRVSA